VLPLGNAGWSVELGDTLDFATNARVRALDRELAERPFAGFVEAVPTLRSLLVLYDERSARPAAVGRELALRLGSVEGAPAVPGRLHEVPTLYGGDAGSDLLPLARGLGLTERELVRLHASGEYTAFMLGFKPGFPYLGLVPPELECARHKTPRVRVPAGSVALAGRQTGIYPVASPGGWQLVGRTSLRLFDPFREEPALLSPGDRVRFAPVAELAEPESAAPHPEAPATPVVLVREPGLLTSVQDAGRSGRRRLGVSGAGPLDAPAHAAANRAVGNGPEAAALECTASGPVLEFLAPVRFAVTGADLGAVLDGQIADPRDVAGDTAEAVGADDDADQKKREHRADAGAMEQRHHKPRRGKENQHILEPVRVVQLALRSRSHAQRAAIPLVRTRNDSLF